MDLQFSLHQFLFSDVQVTRTSDNALFVILYKNSYKMLAITLNSNKINIIAACINCAHAKMNYTTGLECSRSGGSPF